MTRRKLGPGDKTPSQPIKLLSGTGLNLLDLATTLTRLARAHERATAPAARVELGRLVAELGRDVQAIGRAITKENST